MPKFRIDKLGELARQLEFTPRGKRLTQVRAAEELLPAIEPDKAYPLEFIVFRITAYHPRAATDQLLAGSAIQHDLGLLIERVSASLDLRAEEMGDPVLSTQQVGERFNVTPKTIGRWRRSGLAARRLIFPDGKRRIGFLVTTVERFFAARRDPDAVRSDFSPVGAQEQEEIIRRAARLATKCGCCADEIARRIGRKLNRSPFTVLQIVRKHDEQNPATTILAHAVSPLNELERQHLGRAYRQGQALAALARKFSRPRAAIYRVVVQERLERLGRRKIKFIDDPLFHGADAAALIEQILTQDQLPLESKPEDHRVPRDLPPYLQELYRTPLLTPSQERGLFLKFNFFKYQFISARRGIEPHLVRMRDLDLLERHLRAATEARDAIVRANLRLVVSVARKHLRPGLSLMDLVSDGNLTLLRTVESFDIQRGNKFSTYATFALMKGFARSVPQMLASNSCVALDEQLLESFAARSGDRATDRLADRDQVQRLLSRLTPRERDVLCQRYGLEAHANAPGLPRPSKHRLREIERIALSKLRRAFES